MPMGIDMRVTGEMARDTRMEFTSIPMVMFMKENGGTILKKEGVN
jgi:hypothetical protein